MSLGVRQFSQQIQISELLQEDNADNEFCKSSALNFAGSDISTHKKIIKSDFFKFLTA